MGKYRKLKYQKQKDAMHCGVTSLAMLCSLYGRQPDNEHLEKLCAPTSQGVSLKAIIDTAEHLGLKAYGVKASVSELCEDFSPAILHWNQNHFVVLVSISKGGNRFKIADPAKGVYSLSREDFEHHWLSTKNHGVERGIALICEPTDDFYANTREEQALRRSQKRGNPFLFLLQYFAEYKKHFFAIALGLLAASLLQLVLPFLTQATVDIGIAHADISMVWLILLGELFIVAGRTATDFIRSRLLLHISMRINVSLVSDFFIKLLRLPISFFDTRLLGDLLQRMDDHRRVQSFLTGQSLSVLFASLSFVVFGVVLLIYNGMIFGVFLAGSLMYGVWMSLFLRRRRILDYELFEQQAINQNKTYQFLTAMQEIKLQDCERRRRWEWEDVQAGLFDIQMKSLRLEQTQQAGALFINELKNILITILSATAVINGQLSLGAMLAIQFIVGQLNSPIESLINFIYTLQDVKISLERINEVHNRVGEDTNTSANLAGNYIDKTAEINFENVDFRYDKHNPQKTLDRINIKIPHGKVTAIVGASGSGKTTLIKLMLGYYEAEAGTLWIRGTDIKKINKKSLRRKCGVVMQEGVIFADTIANNIAASDGDIDPTRMEHAAKAACLHQDIQAMPLRYNTMIGRDGVKLSQGQKQRVLIARAIYRNPEFIFLDEATNSLDTNNERRIVENLRDFFNGRTVVIVAHRLSTVCDADNIVVLEHGRIAEQGTHLQLVDKRGLYYELVKNQLELGS